ncbi:MAG TPA: Cys-tRNA(Pro) deacylase [Clostridia bacterium]|nr:Cys-tRNA(Pro) deacylase [Clostridia bacterium]
MNKTNVMRLLDSAKISYHTASYEYSEDDLSGVHAAEQISEICPEQCFKTLVARGEKQGILVFCVPVADELDLKRAASAAGDKKVELIAVRELQGITGYIRGGCSPVGMKKKFPVYLDSSAKNYDLIGVSAGTRGLQIILSPLDLADYTGAKFCTLKR